MIAVATARSSGLVGNFKVLELLEYLKPTMCGSQCEFNEEKNKG